MCVIPIERLNNKCSRTARFSLNMAFETLIEHTLHNFDKKRKLDQKNVDWDHARRCQVDSFRELWFWKSTKQVKQFDLLAYSACQHSNLPDTSRGCSIGQTFQNISPQIYKLIKDYKSVVFGDDLEYRDISTLSKTKSTFAVFGPIRFSILIWETNFMVSGNE